MEWWRHPGAYLEGARTAPPQTRQTGLMQIVWNTHGTVNATILRTTPTFKLVAPCTALVCLQYLNCTKLGQFIL